MLSADEIDHAVENWGALWNHVERDGFYGAVVPAVFGGVEGVEVGVLAQGAAQFGHGGHHSS